MAVAREVSFSSVWSGERGAEGIVGEFVVGSGSVLGCGSFESVGGRKWGVRTV